MKRLILCALALVSASGMLSAQQVIRLYDGVAPGSEGVENNERGVAAGLVALYMEWKKAGSVSAPAAMNS